MVLLSSGKLKTIFYDYFEQHEKIEFVDFLYGHIFLRKKISGEGLDSIFNVCPESCQLVPVVIHRGFQRIAVPNPSSSESILAHPSSDFRVPALIYGEMVFPGRRPVFPGETNFEYFQMFFTK